jgi:tetratricopeptide (TPR) repeat protein
MVVKIGAVIGPEAARAAVEEAIEEAAAAARRGELRLAETSLIRASAVAQAADPVLPASVISEVMGLLGDMRAEQKDFRGALSAYKDSLGIAVDLPLAQARAYRRLATAFREHGEDDRAEDALVDAGRMLAQLDASPDVERERAEIDLQTGALSAHRASYRDALEYFRRAERRFEALRDEDGMARTLRRSAATLKEQGQLADAASQLQRATDMLADDLDVADRIELNNLLGTVAYEENAFSRALECFAEARRLATPIGHPLVVDALRGIGLVRDALGEFDEARRMYEDAISRASELNDQVRLSTLLCELGEIHEQQSRFADAIRYYNRALALDQAHQDELGIASALRRLGSAWLERGEFDRADELFEQAEVILRQGEDSDELAQLYLVRGELAEEQCLFDDAREWYDRAQELYGQSGTSADHSVCHLHRASALIRQDRLREAESELSSALSLANASNEFDQIRVKNLLGDVRRAQRRTEEAIRLYREALRLADRFGHVDSRGETLRGLGAAAVADGDFAAAESHYRAAELIFENDEVALVELACFQGELSEARGDAEDALERFRSAHQRARRLDHRRLNVRALLGLGRSYRRRRNLDRAADYLEEAASLATSFQGGATKARVQIELGQLRELEGRQDEAISLYNDALDLVQGQEDENLLQEVHRHLLRAYAASDRDLTSAYEHLLAASTLDNDSPSCRLRVDAADVRRPARPYNLARRGRLL